MRHYVYSTMSTDVAYAYWVPSGQGTMIQDSARTVLIRGGAGVADARLITPQGVVTEVTDDQLEHLRKDEVFKLHERGGFVSVQSVSYDPPKVESVVADMTGRDEAAPLVPQDFASVKDGQAAPAPMGRRSKS